MRINLFLWIFISSYFVLPINSEVCKIHTEEDFVNVKDGCTGNFTAKCKCYSKNKKKEFGNSSTLNKCNIKI